MAAGGIFSRSKNKHHHHHHVDQMPREGLTGMGSHTRRHFIDVAQKLDRFVEEQAAEEFGNVDLFPRPRSRRPHLLQRLFFDGNKSPKPQSQSRSSTPLSPLKRPPPPQQHVLPMPLPSPRQPHHHVLGTPLSSRKQVIHQKPTTPVSARKQVVHHGFASPLANRRGRPIS